MFLLLVLFHSFHYCSFLGIIFFFFSFLYFSNDFSLVSFPFHWFPFYFHCFVHCFALLFYFPFIPFLCAALHSLMVFSLCFGFLSALLCFFSLLSFIYLFLLSFEKFGMAVPCFLLSLNPLFCHHVAFYVFALSWYFFALPSSFCTFFPPLHFPFLLLSICFIVVFFSLFVGSVSFSFLLFSS